MKEAVPLCVYSYHFCSHVAVVAVVVVVALVAVVVADNGNMQNAKHR